MSQVQKARLLQFGTGTASVPVIGFAGMFVFDRDSRCMG